jgi:hypothetical protein
MQGSMTDTKNQPKQTWVKNEIANEIVSRVQNSIASGKIDREAMQQMMDLISGVENYAIWNINRQGAIRKVFEAERIRHNGTKSGRSASFGSDLDDVISTFWECVIKYLPRATSTGGVVPVRVVEGQYDNDTEFDEEMTKAGLQFVQRNTKCNPIHYLRNMGIMGVRNLINKSYRRNIIMVCDDCGVSSSVSTTESNNNDCPKCKSVNTDKYWPDGNSSYRSRKARKCDDCGNIWTRQFERKCYACNSDSVRTEARLQNGEDSIFHVPTEDRTAEDVIVSTEIDAEMATILDRMYAYLPNDPRDPKAISRTKDTFNLLTRPEFSKDMCSKCVSKASLVCEDKCDDFKSTKTCQHSKIPDPNVTCGEQSFTLNKCVNFSKKIGEYHSCSASLAARRVKKVREYVKRYITQHHSSDNCKKLYALMNKMGI